ncbi:MAG: AI-2E family transporter [Bacteroidales bacterium]|nr:AI-2E family transporter [Bacteroidales bacterium]
MQNKQRIIILTVSLLTIGLLAWFFSNIVLYVAIAGILSIIGRPLVKLLDGLRYKKLHLPHALNAVIVLLAMISFAVGTVYLLIPLIAKQALVVSSLDIDLISQNLTEPLQRLESFLIQYGIIQTGDTINSLVMTQISDLLGFATFSNIMGNIAGFAGSLFVGVFAVIFLTFFFLKDDRLFLHSILLFTPDELEEKMHHVLHQTKYLLTRYFLGLCAEVASMFVLLSVGLSIFGVPNALLIALIGSVLNIIPYLGPIIGMLIGASLTGLDGLSEASYMTVVPAMLKVIMVFGIANLIDNLVLQPFIYSNSVKAHPVEIFLVIIMAGSMAGVTGMILAIPTYTVLRIVSSEFFSNFWLVKKLTRNI